MIPAELRELMADRPVGGCSRSHRCGRGRRRAASGPASIPASSWTTGRSLASASGGGAARLAGRCARLALRSADGPGRRSPTTRLITCGRPSAPVGAPEVVLTGLDLDEKVLWNVGAPARGGGARRRGGGGGRPVRDRRAGDAIQSRRTTAQRVLVAMRGARVSDDEFLGPSRRRGHGACSALEHAYLVRVERAHGLPRACAGAGVEPVRSTATWSTKRSAWWSSRRPARPHGVRDGTGDLERDLAPLSTGCSRCGSAGDSRSGGLPYGDPGGRRDEARGGWARPKVPVVWQRRFPVTR